MIPSYLSKSTYTHLFDLVEIILINILPVGLPKMIAGLAIYGLWTYLEYIISYVTSIAHPTYSLDSRRLNFPDAFVIWKNSTNRFEL